MKWYIPHVQSKFGLIGAHGGETKGVILTWQIDVLYPPHLTNLS